MLSVIRAVMPAAIVLAAIAGCSNDSTQTSEHLINTGYSGSSAAPGPRETVPVTAAPAKEQQATPTDQRQHSSYAYPTGHQDTSVLLVERDLPKEIIAGQEFYYDIKVTNINHIIARDVVVRDECATTMKLIKAEPAPVGKDLPLTWNLGDLNPNESRLVHIVGRTTATEPFTSCASATYNQTLCLTAPVLTPALKLTLAAPAEATPCDTIPIKLTVLNSGTWTARDVQLAYALPEGWTTLDGKAAAQFKIDVLEANQTREFVVDTKAAKTGEFTSKATLTANPGLKVEATPVKTAIKQAVLAVKAEAPEHVYAGTPVIIQYTITNNGTTVANNATFEAPLPANLKMLSATDGGVLQNNVVTWKLDPIAVKAARTVTLNVQAGVVGGFDLLGTARAYCAAPVSTPTTVTVFGIPALLLEVADLVDPVAVNGETTYQIVVTNQGSANATNIKLVATLEDNEQYVSAIGGKAVAEDALVTFDPITTLAPKASVTLKLTVKALKEGDTRFKVVMTSDQLKRPVEETESTYIYR